MTPPNHVVAPSELASAWTVDPVLVAALGVAGVLYGRGTARLGERIGGPARPKGRSLAFYAGLVILAAALLSPLDALASTLFAGHMVQHLLLMVVAAPLLVYARPTAALVAGLPSGGRDAVRRASAAGLRGAARTLTRPVVVWGLGTVVLWSWHMPSLYEAALSHDALHAVEHASFFGVAVLFWSVVLGSGARRGVARPVAGLLVLASGVQSTALGAVLLFASSPLYPVHGPGAAAWGTSALEDQQLAGALMWGPPGLVYLVVMGWLLVRWFAEMEEPSADLLLSGAGESA